MASGFLKLQSCTYKQLISCLTHSSFPYTISCLGCRSMMSIAFNAGLADGAFPLDQNQQPINRQNDIISLKEREKGDWRNLTLAEKQTLYRMSFNQPFSEVIDQPADEWKLILASTFTAMGLMTLGIYAWKSQKQSMELFSGPISFQNEVKEETEKGIYPCRMKAA